jgi:hypothetical protein
MDHNVSVGLLIAVLLSRSSAGLVSVEKLLRKLLCFSVYIKPVIKPRIAQVFARMRQVLVADFDKFQCILNYKFINT